MDLKKISIFPSIIRGPGVPFGVADIVTAHTDSAPTILKIAGAEYEGANLDGSPIPLSKDSFRDGKSDRQEHVNVEFWGRSIPKGNFQVLVGSWENCTSTRFKAESLPRLVIGD